MAADTSLPRIQPIVITALVGVLILGGLKFVFDSYFTEMFEAEEYVKVGSAAPKELLALRAAEVKSLANAPIPLDKALDIVAHGRATTAAILPSQSTDTAALVGWASLPKTGLGSLPPVPASAVPDAGTSDAGAIDAVAPAPPTHAPMAVPATAGPPGSSTKPPGATPPVTPVPPAPGGAAPAHP